MNGKAPPLRSSMIQRSRIVRGGMLLTAGKAMAQACSFLRNVIIARVLGAHDYGIAATFALTVSVFEMMGSISPDRLLVQAVDGNDERLQGTAHLVQSIRGFATAILIYLLAPLIAGLFGVPSATWAFRCLAVVPILRGIAHLDNLRIQRELSYGSSVGLDLAQQLIPTLLAWPIAKWCNNYSAMVWIVLLQAFVATAGSFAIAKRKYRWSYDTLYIRRIMTFGWPIVANGLLLFAIFQGDRLLIGGAPQLFGNSDFTLSDLGIFTVATSLTLTPMIAFATVASPLLLPVLARLQFDRSQFVAKYNLCTEFSTLISVAFSTSLIIAGPILVTRLYGVQYQAAGVLVSWMAAAQAIRISRVTPTLAAMALGDTANAMYANLIRASMIIGSALIIYTHGSLTSIAALGFGGELIGLAICLWRLDRDHSIPMSLNAVPGATLITAIVISALVHMLLTQATSQVEIIACIAVLIGMLAFSVCVSPRLRRHLFATYRAFRVRTTAMSPIAAHPDTHA